VFIYNIPEPSSLLYFILGFGMFACVLLGGRRARYDRYGFIGGDPYNGCEETNGSRCA
jgi:hypothetical protein